MAELEGRGTDPVGFRRAARKCLTDRLTNRWRIGRTDAGKSGRGFDRMGPGIQHRATLIPLYKTIGRRSNITLYGFFGTGIGHEPDPKR